MPGFAKAVRYLRDYDGDIQRWWGDFRSRTWFTKEADQALLMLLGVTACFSADADGTPRLPFDPLTGQLIPQLPEDRVHFETFEAGHVGIDYRHPLALASRSGSRPDGG